MRKKIRIIKSSVMLAVAEFFVPAVIFAAAPPDPTENCRNFAGKFGGAFDWMKDKPQYCTIQGFLLWLLQQALMLAGTVAVLFIIYGGYLYLTSGGNEEASEKGRKTLANSVIGLVVIIMSYVIVRVVTEFLTTGK